MNAFLKQYSFRVFILIIASIIASMSIGLTVDVNAKGVDKNVETKAK